MDSQSPPNRSSERILESSRNVAERNLVSHVACRSAVLKLT